MDGIVKMHKTRIRGKINIRTKLKKILNKTRFAVDTRLYKNLIFFFGLQLAQ